jgi:PAS domain S-box-containing protein
VTTVRFDWSSLQRPRRLAASTTISIGFCVALAFLAAFAVASRASINAQLDQAALVNQTHHILETISGLVADQVSAEDFERGYILDLKEHFAIESDSASAEAKRKVDELRRLTVRSPQQRRRIDSLETIIDRRSVLEHLGLIARRDFGQDSANAVRHTLVGAALMRSSRQLAEEMRATELAVLAERSRRAGELATHAIAVVTIGMLLALVLGAFALFFINRDLRTRERTAARLEASEDNLKDFFDNATDLIQATDVDGRLSYTNRAWRETLGYSEQEASALRLADIVVPECKAQWTVDFARLVAGERLQDIELDLLSKHGRTVSIVGNANCRVQNGRPIATRAIFTDVTARREIDRRLRESHALQDAILNGTHCFIVATDPAGQIRSLNAPAAKLIGDGYKPGSTLAQLFDAEELRCRTVELSEELGHPITSDVEAVLVGARHVGVDEREWRFHRPDGSTFPVLASTTALRDARGDVTGYVVVATDITSRKHADEEILRAREAAEAANRAKSEFLSNMSHELRTPLNSVIGFTNILLKNKGHNLVGQDIGFLDRILANGQHLLGLINSILDLSKIEAGKMELEVTSVDVGAIIRATAAELEPQARLRGVPIVAAIPRELCLLETDEPKLKQILINLLSNALKFTDHGSVTIRVQSDPRTGRPQSIDVVDTGVGIPSDRLNAVFQAFQQADNTTSRRYGGTGLGLTITRSLARLMGFDVRVTSEIGSGSTFSVVMEPWRSDASSSGIAAETCTPAVEDAPRVSSPVVVLVIDDQPDARVVLGQYMQDLGCDVVAACSADEGVALARKIQPDLITLDIMMPRKNGWEALSELKADPGTSHIPVVVVSIVASDNRGRLLGAVDCLDKPVTRDALAEVIRRNVIGRDARVLVVSDDSSAAGEYHELAAAGIVVHVVSGIDEAFRAVAAAGIPDLIVLDVGRPAAGPGKPDVVTWMGAIRHDERLIHIPIVVVVSPSLAHVVTIPGMEGAIVLKHGDQLAAELRALVRATATRRSGAHAMAAA